MAFAELSHLGCFSAEAILRQILHILRGTSKPPLDTFYNISETIHSNYLIFGRNYYHTFSNILLKFYCENFAETRKKHPGTVSHNPQISYSQI